jgi:hypothetical protein
VFGWTATLAFAQAVNAVAKQQGVNGLTRANFLKTGIDALTSFNAGGMVGNVNIKNKVPTSCFSLEQVKHGKFTRVYPRTAGTFDCKRSNRVTVKANLIG